MHTAMLSRSLQLMVAASSIVNLAMAASPVEILAQGCKVDVQVFDNLLNTSNYAEFDIAQLAEALEQPVETVTSWSLDTRQYILAELKREITSTVASMGYDVGSVEPEADSGAHLDKRVDERESYKSHERKLLSLHNARVRSADSSCFKHVACGSCVVAAGLAGTAGILGCVGVAVDAEILTAAPTFGLSTAPIWIALGECVAKVSSIAAAAFGTCHTLL
ncbi:hypothetical protein CH63R_03728 [Colletotrichum higginsianum IMI 349063]|uniref:Uncharacterized protein n=3 Tax=Colletotrichum higginsianum TaxID=80884 RepID=A0A1B7YHH4_COLHI|nr:hypothetical protein CH63R_03728 [Colletotrichum higginsianum IMI 349063]OBR11432.1 hypothetical protein CH63R_03728 [Colletotrichum higginsianum IMI 349063]